MIVRSKRPVIVRPVIDPVVIVEPVVLLLEPASLALCFPPHLSRPALLLLVGTLSTLALLRITKRQGWGGERRYCSIRDALERLMQLLLFRPQRGALLAWDVRGTEAEAAQHSPACQAHSACGVKDAGHTFLCVARSSHGCRRMSLARTPCRRTVSSSASIHARRVHTRKCRRARPSRRESKLGRALPLRRGIPGCVKLQYLLQVRYLP